MADGPHYLVITEPDPGVREYVIEHEPSCPFEKCELVGDSGPIPVRDYTCAVGVQETAIGVEYALADVSGLAPGRYPIRAEHSHKGERRIAALEDELEEATRALVRERIRMYEQRQRAEAAEAKLDQARRIIALEAELAEVMVSALARISATCSGVLERIAEVGEPPPWWSGTQLDAARVGTVACEALDAWDRR